MRGQKILSKEFAQLLASLLVFLLCASMLLVWGYGALADMLRDAQVQRATENLRAAIDQFDTQIRDVDNLTRGLLADSRIARYMSLKQPLTGADYYVIHEALSVFPKADALGHSVSNLFLYNAGAEALVSSEYATTRVAQLYPELIGYEGVAYEDWKHAVAGRYYKGTLTPATRVRIDKTDEQYFPYIRSCLNSPVGHIGGAVIALVPVTRLFDAMARSADGAGGWFALQSERGQLLYVSGIAPEALPALTDGETIAHVAGESLLAVTRTSQATDIRFSIAIPTAQYLGGLDRIRRVFLICLGALAAFGIVGAWLVAYFNNRPLRKLVSALGQAERRDRALFVSQLAMVESSLRNLHIENASLFARLRDYTPIVEYHVLQQLLQGERAWADISPQARATLIDIAGWQHYQVFGILVNDAAADPDILNGVFLHNMLEAHLGERFRIIPFANGTFFILAGWTRPEHDAVAAAMAAIQKQAMELYSLSIAVGLSCLYEGIDNTARAFGEASQALAYRAMSGGSVVWFSQIGRVGPQDSISLEDERTLINLARSGDEKELSLAIPAVAQRYLMREDMNHDLLRKFALQMVVIVHRIVSALPGDGQAASAGKAFEQDATTASDVRALSDAFYATMRSLCARFRVGQKSQNQTLKQRIGQYIATNFNSASFSTQSVADAMGISVSYLYHFFKEQFGENYAAYLERTRMEYCLGLMRNRALSLKEIAAMSGYENTNTFYKAFRRVHGMGPREYREQWVMGEAARLNGAQQHLAARSGASQPQ